MGDGRWPKKKAVGGRPLLWPVTSFWALNLTNEKNIASHKSFVSNFFF
jgi:hypothetical protein